MENKNVFVVSYVMDTNEPIISVFDNKENAEKMYNHLKEQNITVWLDECPLYHSYKIFGK